MIIRALSFFLGAVFLVAGVGKLLMIETFAATVASLVPATHAVAPGVAMVIIAIEIAGALALLADYRTRMISLLFCVVVGAFIWVLSAAILSGEELSCNCFGVIGIALSNTQELLLDLVLFNAFAVLAACTPRRDAVLSGGDASAGLRARLAGRAGGSTTPAAWLVAAGEGRTGPLAKLAAGAESAGPVGRLVAGGMLVLLEVLLVLLVLRGGTDRSGLTFDAVIGFAERADARFAARDNGNRALLLMNYTDLNCALCLDDFTVLLDSLESRFGENSDRVLLVFKEDQFIRSDSSRHMRRWIAANGIAFPVFVAPDSVFDRTRFQKSTALVIDRRNHVLLAERFPMGITKRIVALHLLDSSGSMISNSGTLPVSRMRTETLLPF